VLDLVAKTSVKEIHLYDKDYFLQHNAFRAPARRQGRFWRPSNEGHYFRTFTPICTRALSLMRSTSESRILTSCARRARLHLYRSGEPKKVIATKLHEWNIPFVDVGMGVYKAGESLGGIVRVTTSSPSKRDHLERHVSFRWG